MKLKHPKTTIALTALSAWAIFKIATTPTSPVVDIGKSYVLKTTLPACKTVETFEKVMTLHRAGDATSANLYMASGACNILEKGVPYAVTDSTVTMVQVTRNAASYWTPRDSFAANIEQ